MGSDCFKISYSGPALTEHEIDVKDFAPALLAIGELFEESNTALNGDRTQVAVKIRATEPGSVEVVLSVYQNLVSQAASLFNSDGVNAVVNACTLLQVLGFTGGKGGLIWLIKWLRKRNIKNVTEIEAGKYKITTEDNDVRIVSQEEIKLFGLLNIRKKFEAIITKPLDQDGINQIGFGMEKIAETISKDEKDYFTAPGVEDEILDESEVDMNLQIVGISFQSGGKWRFSDGNATFYADIKDEEFNKKVEKNEAVFAKDDLLKAKLKRRQSIGPLGIKTEYEIIKILEHRSAAIQIKLPFS